MERWYWGLLKKKPREVRGVRLHCAIGAGVPAAVSSSIEANKAHIGRHCKAIVWVSPEVVKDKFPHSGGLKSVAKPAELEEGAKPLAPFEVEASNLLMHAG